MYEWPRGLWLGCSRVTRTLLLIYTYPIMGQPFGTYYQYLLLCFQSPFWMRNGPIPPRFDLICYLAVTPDLTLCKYPPVRQKQAYFTLHIELIHVLPSSLLKQMNVEVHDKVWSITSIVLDRVMSKVRGTINVLHKFIIYPSTRKTFDHIEEHPQEIFPHRTLSNDTAIKLWLSSEIPQLESQTVTLY